MASVHPLRTLRRPSWPRFPLFAAVSLAVHAAVFAELARAPRGSASPTFDPISQRLEGDTLDVEPRSFAASPPRSSDVSPDVSPASQPAPAPLEKDPLDKAAAIPTPHAMRRAIAERESRRTSSPAPPPALFGAVGVRTATDLATAFTRAFPQAASADGLWATVPFGSAGVADVTLVLDEGGSLSATRVDGTPSLALRRGIARTFALLGPRAFTAQGAVTRLRITAHVTRDDVHDGLHGDVFALSGGSFAGEVGTAFFALPADAQAGGRAIGRRVDVSLRLAPPP